MLLDINCYDFYILTTCFFLSFDIFVKTIRFSQNMRRVVCIIFDGFMKKEK